MTNQIGDYAVGIDIGGTNMVAAVITEQSAKVLSRASILTEPERGPDDGFYRLGNLIEQVCQEKAQHILSTHQPKVLPFKAEAELEYILRRYLGSEFSLESNQVEGITI